MDTVIAATLASSFGIPWTAAFIGSWCAMYLTCPNRGCCQMKKVREVIEQ